VKDVTKEGKQQMTGTDRDFIAWGYQVTVE